MLKNMKLSAKIAGGFGIILIITIAVGVFAVVNMFRIEKDSKQLANEYIAEVDLASQLERAVSSTILDIRSYALSENRDYLKTGKEKLDQVKKLVNDIEKFSQLHPELEVLAKEIGPLKENVTGYDNLVNQTITEDDIIDKDRDLVDQTVVKINENVHSYLNSESNEAAITLIRNIEGMINQILTENYKSQAMKDINYVQDSIKNYDTLDTKVNQLRTIAIQGNKAALVESMSNNIAQYKTNLEHFINNWIAMQDLNAKRTDVANQVLGTTKGLSEKGMERTRNVAEGSVRALQISYWLLIFGFIVAITLCIIIAIVIIKAITKPVEEMKLLMAEAENGNLTVGGKIYSNDEIGQLTGSFNRLIGKIRLMTKDIFDTTKVMNQSSDGLLHVAETMATVSEETSAKTVVVGATVEEITASIDGNAQALTDTSGNMNVIASAVEEMSGTIRNLASASEQTSAGVAQVTDLVSQISGSIHTVSNSAQEVSLSVNSVVTSVKEINISLNEVSKNCERSIIITSDAGMKAKDTNDIIGRLNESSKQIGKIVSVINDIADQTNMLALNAAIEAAGAGEAGKGFAVVANEVKELAKQTAEATDEIGQQIEAMHGNMSGAVKAVETITEVIKEITSITNTIAAAVTEQSATTSEISSAIVKAAERVNQITGELGEIAANSQGVTKSISEASKGVKEIAHSAAELSTASSEVSRNTENATVKVQEVARTSKEISKGSIEISRNIQEISAASSEAASGASDTTNAAKKLSGIAHKLEELVSQFKV